MRLLLVKICAVAAVNLVADGADAQAPNYITEPARALRHDPSIKRLRAQQNADEERVNNVAAAFDRIIEQYRPTNSVLPDVVTSALKSKHFNDFFDKLSTEGVSIDDVDKAIKGRETDVTAAIRDAYAKFKEMEFMRFINEFDLDNSPGIPHSAVEPVQPTLTQPVHLPLAQPVRPTLAESVHPVLAGSVHPTLADPVSARLNEIGPAEAIGGQLDPKVSIHPTDGLSLPNLEAIKGRETDVTAAIPDAYATSEEMEFMRFINEFDLDNSPGIPHSAVEPVQPTLTQPVHLPLAQPVRPTLAEPVHPVLAGSVHPVSARLNEIGPAKAIGGQLDPKVLIHPTDGLSLPNLDKEPADKICSIWSEWIKIVKNDNDFDPVNPKLAVDAMKIKWGIKEKTLVDAAFSLDLPQNTRGNMNFDPKDKDEIRHQIFDELTKSWLKHNADPGDLLPTFGLVPTLPTGHDFARLVEWMKYAERWNKKREPPRYLPMTEIASILMKKKYTAKQLLKFLKHSDGEHGDLGNRMIAYLTNPEEKQPVSPNSLKKRKRDS